ncbi:MAG: dipeptidase PepV [Clostridiales bacterium]|jgi:succinyl-diaminopimelate desuccinylase|nr:dipeptidase PepV [Clostridiales bacterium]
MDLDLLIESYRSDMIRSVCQLIAIPSVEGPAEPGMPFGPNVYKALEYMLQLGKEMGFSTKNVDGYAGHIEFGQGDRMMGILVHLDVVPPGGGWTYPPFGAEIHHNRIYGRGSIDDKGPAVAALYAMKAVKEAGLPIGKRVRLILGTDEESGWEDLRHYFKHEPMPDFGVSPDGRYPVINAEKGILHVALKRKFSQNKVSSIGLLKMTGGQRPNMVPDECNCVFDSSINRNIMAAGIESLKKATGYDFEIASDERDNLIIKALGKPAHASAPETGRNAIGQMLAYLASLGLGQSEMERFILFLHNRVGMEIQGESMGLAMEDKLSGKLTLNLGMINVDGESGEAVIDIRYPVSVDKEQVLARIEEVAAQDGIEVDVLTYQPPLYVPEDHFLVRTLMEVYAGLTGKAAYTVAIGGGTYARAIENAVAFGAVFPGKPELAHQKDEYIEIEDLILNCRIYAHAIARLVSSR